MSPTWSFLRVSRKASSETPSSPQLSWRRLQMNCTVVFCSHTSTKKSRLPEDLIDLIRPTLKGKSMVTVSKSWCYLRVLFGRWSPFQSPGCPDTAERTSELTHDCCRHPAEDIGLETNLEGSRAVLEDSRRSKTSTEPISERVVSMGVKLPKLRKLCRAFWERVRGRVGELRTQGGRSRIMPSRDCSNLSCLNVEVWRKGRNTRLVSDRIIKNDQAPQRVSFATVLL